MIRFSRSFFALAALLMVCGAQGATIYNYVGYDYRDGIVNDTPPDGTYTHSMRVEGSFSVAAPLPEYLTPTDITADIVSYAFSDGRNTLTESNSYIRLANVVTDSAGDIQTWAIRFRTPNFPEEPFFDFSDLALSEQIITIFTTANNTGFDEDGGKIWECTSVALGECVDLGRDDARSRANPGVWGQNFVPTLPTQPLPGVPIPATAWLFLSALGGLGLIKRKRS